MDTQMETFDRRGYRGGHYSKRKVYSNVVCQFWLAGNCNRDPCRFLHRDSPPPPTNSSYVYKRNPNQYNHFPDENRRKTTTSTNYIARRSSMDATPNNLPSTSDSIDSKSMCSTTEVAKDKTMNTIEPCRNWISGKCFKGDGCRYLHSWFCGDWFSMIKQLNGHTRAICGIALPPGSDKVYSGSIDGTVQVWDCCTGQSTGTINLGEDIGCLVAQGPWIFVGLQNKIKAWNVETQLEYTLGEGNELFGLVYAIATSDVMLFSGAQDGSILAWGGSNDNLNPFKVAASLKGHTAGVTCLIVDKKTVYSGSIDGSIGVWDLDTLNCLHILREAHTDAVMSLICWGDFLLSCSLDKKIKIWAATEEGAMKVVYTHDVQHGAIDLCGIQDIEDKPVLLCSCNNDCISLFDLPSFEERGRIFSKDEVRRIERGPSGLFFTGDGSGKLTVWKLTESSSSSCGQAL